MLDQTSCIWFSSIFPKKAWTILWKTDPDLIWRTWSGFGQTRLIQKQAGVQKSSGLVSGRMQPAHYQFPTFKLGCVLLRTVLIIIHMVQKQPWSNLVRADCVGFGPNRFVPEASWCVRFIRPASGQCFWVSLDQMCNQIQHVSWYVMQCLHGDLGIQPCWQVECATCGITYLFFCKFVMYTQGSCSLQTFA